MSKIKLMLIVESVEIMGGFDRRQGEGLVVLNICLWRQVVMNSDLEGFR